MSNPLTAKQIREIPTDFWERRDLALHALREAHLIELIEMECEAWSSVQKVLLDDSVRIREIRELKATRAHKEDLLGLLSLAGDEYEHAYYLARECCERFMDNSRSKVADLEVRRHSAVERLRAWVSVCKLLPAAYFLTLRSGTPSAPPSSGGGSGSNLPSAPLPDRQIQEEEATECLHAINATLMLEGEPPPDEIEDLDPDDPDDDTLDTLDGDVSLTVEVKERMVVEMWKGLGRIPATV